MTDDFIQFTRNIENVMSEYECINLCQRMRLTCGCRVDLWKVLTLLAMAAEEDRELRCPYHHVELLYPAEFKSFALTFLNFMRSPEGRELVPDFWLPGY